MKIRKEKGGKSNDSGKKLLGRKLEKNFPVNKGGRATREGQRKKHVCRKLRETKPCSKRLKSEKRGTRRGGKKTTYSPPQRVEAQKRDLSHGVPPDIKNQEKRR